MQRRYHRDELRAFLQLVDAELQRPCTLMLVGGAALSLGYCPSQAATELEAWSCSDDRLWPAMERASAKVPRPIRMGPVLVREPHLAFEDRTWSVPAPELRFMDLRVPEAHDHVMLKLARAEPLDFVGSLHREHPLKLPTLLERYGELKALMTWRRQRFEASFLGLVAKLFGAARAESVGADL